MNKMFFYRCLSVVFLTLTLVLVPVSSAFATSLVSSGGGGFGGGGASGSFSGSPSISSGKPVFGGKIKAIIPCTCSPGMGIIVGPPKPAILLFVPGLSRLFSNGRLFPGSWTLGDYSSGGVCMQIAGKTCAPYPPIQGTIIKIGTS